MWYRRHHVSGTSITNFMKTSHVVRLTEGVNCNVQFQSWVLEIVPQYVTMVYNHLPFSQSFAIHVFHIKEP